MWARIPQRIWVRLEDTLSQVCYIPFSFCESPRNDIIACRRRSRCLRWSFRFILSTFVGHVEGFWFYIPKKSEKLKLQTIFLSHCKVFVSIIFWTLLLNLLRFRGHLATNMADSTRWSQLLLWRYFCSRTSLPTVEGRRPLRDRDPRDRDTDENGKVSVLRIAPNINFVNNRSPWVSGLLVYTYCSMEKSKAGKTHWQPGKPSYWVATRGSSNFFSGHKNTAESTQQETIERSGEWSTVNFITTWFFNPLDSFWRKRGGRPEYSETGAGTIANYIVDCSQSPIFSWDRRDIARLLMTAILVFKCTEGAGVGDYSSRGRWARKISIFLASSQTAPCPLPPK